MELDPEIVQSVLFENGPVSFWNDIDMISNQISTSESYIKEMEARIEDKKNEIADGKQKIIEIRQNYGTVDQWNAELQEIESEMEKPIQVINSFFENEQNNLNIYHEYCCANRALAISSFILDEKPHNADNLFQLINECKGRGYNNLQNIIQQKYEDLLYSQRHKLYSQIESKYQVFSVTKEAAIKKIFLDESSEVADKGKEFNDLIDQVIKIDSNWPMNLSEICIKILRTRFLYHCQNVENQFDQSYICFVVSLLRTTIQHSFISLLHAEQLAETSIFDRIATSLMSLTIDQILTRNNASVQFYRTIFDQSAAFDRWLESTEFFNTNTLSSLFYDTIGADWIDSEIKTMKAFTQATLFRADYGLTLCSALAKLADSAPLSLTTPQKENFMKECIVPTERSISSILNNSFTTHKSNYMNISSLINTLQYLSTQLSEIYEIGDGMCPELHDDAHALKDNIVSRCEDIAKKLLNIFIQAGQNYLLANSVTWHYGSMTPSLADALTSISEPLKEIKMMMEKTIFYTIFMPSFVRSIDQKVYTMLVQRINWAQNKAVDQFLIDLDAMINIFGPDDLRLLRSAKIILTQKEEKYLNYELPEEDVEKFIRMMSSV